MPGQIPKSDQPLAIDSFEVKKVTDLLIAQDKSAQLFRQVEAKGLIRTGTSESRPNREIYNLAHGTTSAHPP